MSDLFDQGETSGEGVDSAAIPPAGESPPAPPASEEDEHRAREWARAHRIISAWMSRLVEPTQTVEMRCLRVLEGVQGGVQGGSTLVGHFQGSEVSLMVDRAMYYSGSCAGIYYTMNPLNDRWGRQLNRMNRANRGVPAEDKDVIARRWLLVDVDPIREKGCEKLSATDGEKEAAWEVLVKVREYLTGEGWPAAVVSDSGNGYHLLYRVEERELMAEDTEAVKRLLCHLASKFDTAHATVDRSVYNLSRIVKFPGTFACKGPDGVKGRPWRRAKVLEMPAEDAERGDDVAIAADESESSP